MTAITPCALLFTSAAKYYSHLSVHYLYTFSITFNLNTLATDSATKFFLQMELGDWRPVFKVQCIFIIKFSFIIGGDYCENLSIRCLVAVVCNVKVWNCDTLYKRLVQCQHLLCLSQTADMRLIYVLSYCQLQYNKIEVVQNFTAEIKP